MTTLNQREVQDVLFRLYAEAQTNDSKIQAEEQALLAVAGGIIDDRTLQSINDRTFMAVAPEVGRLIYLLVRTRRPALVVEFGTSFGLSAIHIASGLRDNRLGHLITTELTLKADDGTRHVRRWIRDRDCSKALVRRHWRSGSLTSRCDRELEAMVAG